MGSFFKSKTKTTKQPFENSPWKPQQPYLLEGFEQALDQLNKAQSGLGKINDPVANLNQQQLEQIRKGIGLGNQAQNVGSQVVQQGQNLSGLLNNASGKLNQIDMQAQSLIGQGNQYANAQRGMAQNLTQTGNQFGQVGQQANRAAQSAGNNLLDISSKFGTAGLRDTTAIGNMIGRNQNQNVQGADQFAQNAQGIFSLSGNYAQRLTQIINQALQSSNGVLDRSNQMIGDGTVSGIVSDAQQVANNPYLQSQIDNAISDVQRGFENTQAQINANASGAGGMNSTRAALLESKALESAQRTAGNISSQMRSDAYNTGLNTALQNKSQNNALLNTQLGAGQQQIGINDQQIAIAGQDLQSRLAANSQYGQGQQMATDARNTAVNQSLNNAQLSQGIRNDQFSQAALGHNMKLSGYDQLMAGLQGKTGAQTAAGSLLNNAGNTALSAGSTGLEALMGNNAQRVQLGGLGQDLINSGFALASGGNSNAFDYASQLQQQQQNEIDGRLNLNRNGLDLVAQYLGAIGGNYGSQGYQTTVSKSASPFQQLVGGATSLLGAFG